MKPSKLSLSILVPATAFVVLSRQNYLLGAEAFAPSPTTTFSTRRHSLTATSRRKKSRGTVTSLVLSAANRNDNCAEAGNLSSSNANGTGDESGSSISTIAKFTPADFSQDSIKLEDSDQTKNNSSFSNNNDKDKNNVNNNSNNNIRKGSMAAATAALGKVPYGETSRKYRRTIFTHNDWVEHRSSSSRIFDNLQSMFFSGVVRQLRPQVSAVTGVAALVVAWNIGVVDNVIFHPEYFEEFAKYFPTLHPIALPTVPFTLSSPALGLLLVFRTNAAYARWMEARTAWARMITHGKNLVRMTSVFSTSEEEVRNFNKSVWLYLRTVMNQLSSPEEDDELYVKEVRDVFREDGREDVAERILGAACPTTAAWKQVSMELHAIPARDPKSLIETDKSVIILGECTDICAKIYSSPVPLVYTRHTARFLSLWALLLPTALYTSFTAVGQEWAVLPASSVLAFFLFGVDELAMQLEEPFSILPMSAFCNGVLKAGKIMSSDYFEEDDGYADGLKD